MNCLPLTNSGIPLEVESVAIDVQTISLEGNISTETVLGEIKVQFPSGYEKLPLIGGAVISFEVKELSLNPDPKIDNILTKELKELSSLSLKYSLNSLSDLQVSINKLFYDIAKKDFKILDKKAKAPSLYFSIFRGEDPSVINNNVYIPGLDKVCEFRYIPFQVFKEVFKNLKLAPGYLSGGRNKNFQDMVGTAGRKYSTLSSYLDKSSVDDSEITDLILEFFPIVNIDYKDIITQKNNPDIGGYYTIINDKIFLKMPDLSGRSVDGIAQYSIVPEDFLCLEMYSNASATRMRIDKFAPPIVGDFSSVEIIPDDFPTQNSFLELKVNINTTLDAGVKLYLSPIIINPSLSYVDFPYSPNKKAKYITGYNESLEVFTYPQITVGIEEGREPIINTNENVDIIDASNVVAQKYFSTKYWNDYLQGPKDFSFIYNSVSQASGPAKQVGDNDLLLSLDPYAFYGIRNRPEIMISPPDGSLNLKNQKKYVSLSSYGKINILSSIMPKINKNIPKAWISADLNYSEEEEIYIARIPYSEFEGINLDLLLNEIRYAAYLYDDNGQITKVSGPLINLTIPKPSIESIVPNGFDQSGSISFDDSELNIVEIIGEDLDQVQKIEVRSLGIAGSSIQDIENSYFQYVNPNLILFNIPPGYFLDNFTQVGQKFSITLIDKKGNKSQPGYIYVTAVAGDERPRDIDQPAYISSNEFYSTHFGKSPILGVPLFKDGNNALIKIGSNNKIFKKNNEFYVYLALPTVPNGAEAIERLQHFSFSDRIVPFKIFGKNVFVPLDIFHVMKNSSSSSFYRISNKTAAFKFPGPEYSRYNFSILNGIKEAYFLITNQPLNSLSREQLESPDSILNFSYSYLKVGDGDTPAFIDPFSIVDIVAKDASGAIYSTCEKSKYSQDIYGENFSGDFTIGKINVYNKIKNLILFVSGINERNLDGKYDFYLGEENISGKLSKAPSYIYNGVLAFEFKNVSSNKSGIVELSVRRKRSPFISRYQTKEYFAQATLLLGSYQGVGLNEVYRFDDNLGLELNYNQVLEVYTGNAFTQEFKAKPEDFSNVRPVIIGLSSFDKSNPLDCLFLDRINDGIIFDKTYPNKNANKLFYPIGIQASTELNLRDENDKEISVELISGDKNIKILDRKYISIPSGAVFPGGSYLKIDPSEEFEFFLLFLTTSVYGFASIGFNIPEIVYISKLSGEFIPLDQLNRLVAGEQYRVGVRNTDRNFDVILGGVKITPDSPPEFNPTEKLYIAIITIPAEIANMDLNIESIEIGISIENEEFNRANYILTSEVVNEEDDCDRTISRLPGADLFEKIKQFPLKFVNFLLDKSFPAKLALNSFCDLSFDLTKELKFALNGFRSLMIPVQVIFCIIDVLCSLLNPVKLARSLVRLFECLYDLITLIPAISVPVMYLQLIAHMIELLTCVFDKIELTARAINDIVAALNYAFKSPRDYTAMKSLEETLEQYLDEIDLDLKFLDPIVSILDIFLQLLQIVFRFPCRVSPLDNEDDIACGIDGTMLAGLVVGFAAPNSIMNSEYLLPIAQTYTNDPLGDLSSPINPTFGTTVATRSDTASYYESMNVDGDSLRADGAFSFNATFAPSYTKIDRKGKRTGIVEFEFRYQCENRAVEPNQTADAPFALFNQVNDSSLVIGDLGNLYSPIDGEKFLNINISDRTASVKPLTLNFEIPINEIDPATGFLQQVGTQIVTRTFDNIPMMAIIDDESNLYFVEKDGIEYNSDGYVDKIIARIVNQSSAPKHKFSREDDLYDFPQIYFFDMRQVSDDLQQYCVVSSINSFPLEDNNAEDILSIVQGSLDCITEWRDSITKILNRIREQRQTGGILDGFDLQQYDNYNQNIVRCLNSGIEDICKYVINSLNTSFKILEDRDYTPRKAYVDGILPDSILEGVIQTGPSFSGAREYAAGIGDNAVVRSGGVATIEIIPRDVYDNEITGDFSDKISIEIVFDRTGGAQFVADGDGKIITKVDNTYVAKLTSSGEGEVRIRASICDRTIQALTYQDLLSQVSPGVTPQGCVPNTQSEQSQVTPPFGSLSKVDRILSIYFRGRTVTSGLAQKQAQDEAITEPQEFGTALEN